MDVSVWSAPRTRCQHRDVLVACRVTAALNLVSFLFPQVLGSRCFVDAALNLAGGHSDSIARRSYKIYSHCHRRVVWAEEPEKDFCTGSDQLFNKVDFLPCRSMIVLAMVAVA